MEKQDALSGIRFGITVKGKAALANWEQPAPLTDAAIRRLFETHTPRLKRIACGMGVPSSNADHLVTTLLDDVVIYFIHRQFVPNNLYTYLTAALRNRVRKGRRAESSADNLYCRFQREQDTPQDALEIPGEYNDAPASEALAKLAAVCMSARLDNLDTLLLLSVGEPVQRVAADLHITPTLARVRLHRARHRIVGTVAEYLDTLDNGKEKTEIARFLRRASR